MNRESFIANLVGLGFDVSVTNYHYYSKHIDIFVQSKWVHILVSGDKVQLSIDEISFDDCLSYLQPK